MKVVILQTKIPEEPKRLSWLELFRNFESAAKRWKDAGFPVVSWDEFKARSRKCFRCECRKRGVIPHCKVCGCTDLKLWLATEKCPKGYWQPLTPNQK